jgi:hypothetical protein
MGIIKWQIIWTQRAGEPYLTLIYVNYTQGWEGWSIERLPLPDSATSKKYLFQVKFQGEPIGTPFTKAKDAKDFAAREGVLDD